MQLIGIVILFAIDWRLGTGFIVFLLLTALLLNVLPDSRPQLSSILETCAPLQHHDFCPNAHTVVV